jgi:flagellar hook-length control protein FliK
MIGKNMKVGALVFGMALSGGVLAGSVLGAPGATSAASNTVAAAATTATDSGATGTAAATPETPLTGDVAAQVTAAAQAAVPDGTIDRVETDNDGVYEAHVTKADGTHVIVQVGADYAVTATIDQPQGGPGGPGGPGNGGPGSGETLLTGDTAASVTAAAQAAVPDGTIVRVETDSDGSPYEAHVTKADGTQVVVKVDASFTVTATEDMPTGGPQGGRHQGPPPAAPSTTDSSTTASVTG